MNASPPVALSVEPLEPREVPSTAYQNLPILPTSDPAVLDNARAIAERGRLLGRNDNVFMRVGDSNSSVLGIDSNYLTPLGQPGYNPFLSGLAALHPELLDTLNTYRQPIGGGIYN